MEHSRRRHEVEEPVRVLDDIGVPVGVAEVELDAVGRIGALRNMTIVNRVDGHRALKLWLETGVKLADCLIATQMVEGITLVTYDREFRKIPGLAVAEPNEILNQVGK